MVYVYFISKLRASLIPSARLPIAFLILYSLILSTKRFAPNAPTKEQAIVTSAFFIVYKFFSY